MAKDSLIGWCDATCNPWYGCRHVDDSCTNCYMYSAMRRYGKDPTQVRRSKTTFNDPLKWKEGRRIFTCSWSDFFIQEADAWRQEFWDIIRATPQHTYMILTKRPSRIPRCLPPDWGDGWPHVWLGVSGGDPAWLTRRLPLLRRIPAVVRFLSIEPLLAPIETLDLTGISWVIVGGESGKSAAAMRPMPHRWVWPLRDACQAADVPFFFKQSSAFQEGQGDSLRHEDGTFWLHRSWPDERHDPMPGEPHALHGETIGMPRRLWREHYRMKMPPTCKCVHRRSRWGNPFDTATYGTAAHCVALFIAKFEHDADYRASCLRELAGFDLACFCKPGTPCHADVLLRWANAPQGEGA